ncbi:MAG: pyridoxamine 5'-phosphate oxidase family protein [Acidobacteriota bacterium]
MPELQRLPRDLHAALSGEGFRRRRRLVLPLLTTDPEGFPRVALLTLGEVRSNSTVEIAIAVQAESRTAFNLVRRSHATLLYLNRRLTASVQARAGRGRVCNFDPARRVFPLRVVRVRIDRPGAQEGDVALMSGPTFSGADADRLFSEALFAELGGVRSE